MSEGERLQKVMAHAGVASRRACEELIAAGRVTVDHQVVTRMGTRVDPDNAVIHVDGKRVIVNPDIVTYLVNKPVGVVSTMSDPQGRPNLGDLADVIGQRLFHIGRLDEHTSGLILLSNDGELAHRVMHPSYELEKVYIATVTGRFTGQDARTLCDGVTLEDGPARADKVTVVDRQGNRTMIEMTLHMGKNRIVRRLCAAVGHPVVSLARVRLGPLSLGDLDVGEYRLLDDDEVAALYHELDL